MAKHTVTVWGGAVTGTWPVEAPTPYAAACDAAVMSKAEEVFVVDSRGWESRWLVVRDKDGPKRVRYCVSFGEKRELPEAEYPNNQFF